MVRFKITKGFEVSWDGNVWLRDFPFAECLAVVERKSKAKYFYKDDEKKIMEILDKKKVKYETEGTSENRPRTVLK